jgi:hypothetical protein
MELLTIDEALRFMFEVLAANDKLTFQLGIVGYFIEGIPYPADGLWVSAESTPKLVETHDGFACDAFFPPRLLDPATVKARGLIVSESGTEVVPVRLEVKRRDTWSIAEFVHGVQHDLFLDADVLIARKEAFVKEREMWLERPERSH